MELLFLLFLFSVFRFILKSSSNRSKGVFGEKRVAKILSTLPPEEYKVINNVVIKNNNNIVQIDHIVVSIYGIFVIETKNYKGWISGSDNSEYWIQHIFGNKYNLYNPIKQNRSHILALSKILNLSVDNFISIVCFLNKADLLVKSKFNVVHLCNLIQLIKVYSKVKYQKNTIQIFYEKIILNNARSRKSNREHILKIKNKISAKQQMLKCGICPRCGHNLVVRNGKYGKFLGCSNFPKCHFIQSLDN